MGLFDFFKKNPTPSKPNALSLEVLLQKAAKEPAYRAEFYKRLLADELVILTDKMVMKEGTHHLEKDTEVNICSLQDGKIPVFTSTERIFDKGVIKEQVPFMAMKGKNLFELAKGATFLLNPYSDYGKELLPGEVERMLNGTNLNPGRQIVIQKKTSVQIGEPAVYPTEIVNSLKTLFSNKSNVKSAYVAFIHNPESGDPPHYIFAIEGEGDQQSLTQDAGFTANQFLKSGEIIDIFKLNPSNTEGIDQYFLRTEPFYRRTES